MIFSGKSGKQHGYQDGRDNPNVFTYTGDRQVGDMRYTKGNLALCDHLANGKRVFLFESAGKGFVRFIAEVECFDTDYFETPDTSGQLRIGIKFFFKRVGLFVPLKARISDQPALVAEPAEIYRAGLPGITERKGLITTRVGQGVYRKRIIHRWEYQCAVTGFDKLDVLIDSHIVPWSEATHEERLDVHNGILLSPTYDALFDRHLISFENNGKIILSESIAQEAYAKIGVTGRESISNLSEFNQSYLEKHRSGLVV